MARTRSSKKAILEQLEDKLNRSKSIIFSSFQGLRVKEVDELRGLLHKAQMEVMMAKKTLLKRALEKNKINELDPKQLQGEVTVTFSYHDEVLPARILAKFAKDHESLKLLAGMILSAPPSSRVLSQAGVVQLSRLPSREELIAKVVGSLAAPLRGTVTVLQGNLRGFARVLQGIADIRS